MPYHRNVPSQHPKPDQTRERPEPSLARDGYEVLRRANPSDPYASQDGDGLTERRWSPLMRSGSEEC